eukprot:1140960-Pelagomonas_calceolata.AAC.1
MAADFEGKRFQHLCDVAYIKLGMLNLRAIDCKCDEAHSRIDACVSVALTGWPCAATCSHINIELSTCKTRDVELRAIELKGLTTQPWWPSQAGPVLLPAPVPAEQAACPQSGIFCSGIQDVR